MGSVTYSLADLGNMYGSPNPGKCAQQTLDDPRCESNMFAYSSDGKCFCKRSGTCDFEKDRTWNVYCVGSNDNCFAGGEELASSGKLKILWYVMGVGSVVIGLACCYIYGCPIGSGEAKLDHMGEP